MTDRWGEDPAIELGPTRGDPADPAGAGDRRVDERSDADPPMASTAAIAEAADHETTGETEGRRGTGPQADARDPADGDARARADREQVVEREPPAEGERRTAAGTSGSIGSSAAGTPLFDESATRDLRGRWGDVQAGFVDEPRSAVENADALVAEVMKRLAEGFASERRSLEEQWSRGGDVSTEELRLALQRYRSFFDRLLSV